MVHVQWFMCNGSCCNGKVHAKLIIKPHTPHAENSPFHFFRAYNPYGISHTDSTSFCKVVAKLAVYLYEQLE